MGQVYGISLPGGPIRYVGLTTKLLEQRLAEHRYYSLKRHKTPLDHWLRKHPEATIQALEEIEDQDQLKATEIVWIEKLGTHVDRGLGGLNATAGGDGGVSPSEETKAKIRAGVIATQQGRPELLANLQVHRAGEPAWNKGRIGDRHTPETRAKMSAAHKGQNPEAARAALTPEVVARRNVSIKHAWHIKKGAVEPSCPLCRKEVI